MGFWAFLESPHFLLPLPLAFPCFTFHTIPQYRTAAPHPKLSHASVLLLMLFLLLECLSHQLPLTRLQTSPVTSSPLLSPLGSHTALDVPISEKLPLSTGILSVSVTPPHTLNYKLPRGRNF